MKLRSNLRTVTGAAIAVLAMTFGVTSATASTVQPQYGFTADQYGEGTVISGASNTGWENTFKVIGGAWQCVPPSFETPQGAPSTTLTTEWFPWNVGVCYDYSLNGNSKPPLELNGCEFTLEPGELLYESTFSGTLSIGPPGCGPIAVDLLQGLCYVDIDPETGYSADVLYENRGEGSGAYVNVHAAIEKMEADLGGSACAEKGSDTASYSPSWKVTAEDELESMGVQVGKLPTGLYIDGEESEEESQQPRFEAESYPLPISGEQEAEDGVEFSIAGSAVQCEAASFEGELAQADDQVGLGAELDGCTVKSFPVTVEMNSCTIVSALANGGPPYTGSASIACAEAGDQIEFDVRNGAEQICLARVPAQSLGGSVNYENQGEGVTRHIHADLAATGMQWTRSGFCLYDGKGSSGSGELSGGISLRGEF